MSGWFPIALLLATLASADDAAGPSVTPAAKTKPSTLAPERCRAALPSDRRASENYREYYDKFLDMICTGEAAQDERWQSCILKSMRAGRFRPDDISEAYNDCIPEARDCLADMSSRPHPGVPDYRGFVRGFCKNAFTMNSTERKCILKLAGVQPTFTPDDKSMYLLCADGAQACVQDLLSANFGKWKRGFLDSISRICERPIEDLPPDYRACMHEDFDAGRVADPDLSWRSCAPALRPKRECIRRQFSSADFRASVGREGTDRTVKIAASLCDVKSADMRACLLRTVARPLSYESAQAVCRYSDADVRVCMTDYYESKGVFKGVQPSYSDSSFADTVCTLPDPDDRACVVTGVRNFDYDYRGSAIGFALRDCAKKNAGTKTCKKDFNSRYKLQRGSDDPIVNVVADNVCEILIADVRSCAVRRIFSDGLDFAERSIAACQADYLNRLLAETKVPCPPAHE